MVRIFPTFVRVKHRVVALDDRSTRVIGSRAPADQRYAAPVVKLKPAAEVLDLADTKLGKQLAKTFVKGVKLDEILRLLGDRRTVRRSRLTRRRRVRIIRMRDFLESPSFGAGSLGRERRDQVAQLRRDERLSKQTVGNESA